MLVHVALGAGAGWLVLLAGCALLTAGAPAPGLAAPGPPGPPAGRTRPGRRPARGAWRTTGPVPRPPPW